MYTPHRKRSHATHDPSDLLNLIWQVGYAPRRMESELAKRTANTPSTSITQAALAGEKQLTAWLEQNPIYIYEKGTPEDERVPANAKSSTARRCVFQCDVPPAVFVAMVTEARDDVPGSMKDGDLTDGVLARVARRSLLPKYTSIEDVEKWENARAEASTKLRGQRMRKLQGEVKKARTLADKLAESMAANPELAAMIAALGIDTDISS